MDSNQYYQDLIQQGYSSADAANFTQQYYPDFQGTAQGMSMMTPPPPGSMEMGAGLAGQGVGGIAAGGMGTGGMAAGGITAGATGAAATGGMSVATIAIVSVLVLGGVGTGGYFLYDYLTEPDFYGEIYWMENGYGYIFEEDHFSIAMSLVNGECNWDGDDSLFKEPKKVDGLCIMEYSEDYELTDEGDYFKICIGDEGNCLKVYPKDRGIIMSEPSTGCMILVSDISNPSMIEEESEYDTYTTLSQEWYDEFETISKEIEDDGMPSSCGESKTFQFDDRDAANDPPMSANGSDALVHVSMTQGYSIDWSLIEIRIVVDGSVSNLCVAGDSYENIYYGDQCTYSFIDDNYWDVAEEITISEGENADLCDGSNDCVVDVMIIKKPMVGNDGQVFLSSSTRNPDNFVQFDWRDALNDPEMSEDGGDALIHIQMMKGQSINWALVEVSIGYGTDDGVQKCVDIRNPDEDGQMCTYSFLDEEGNEWDLGEEITISEGANQELCDGVAELCEVVITIGVKAAGDSDGRDITIWTNAEP